MAKLGISEIRSKAVDIVKQSPGGIRYSLLVERLHEISPETPVNTIHGSVWDLHTRCPRDVQKPSRGLFVPAGSSDQQLLLNEVIVTPEQIRFRESDFYTSFAEYLKNDLDEVTAASHLGGAAMGKKWGTPDVVGVYKPSIRDMIKFGIEIVSAEIKIDPQQPVVAFGQAIAYRLFSSKTYVVMPATIAEEDSSRLETLCMLFGVGLVLFQLQPENPNFTIRVRAQRFFPDMFYVNEFADRLHETDPKLFADLLG